MAYLKKEKPVYTKDYFLEVIKTCESKSDFTKKYPKLYRILIHREYGHELINLLPRKIKWTEEKLIEEAKKYKNKAEWMRNNISAYNIALKNKELYKKCTEHMENKYVFGKTIYTYDYCKEVYSKYGTIKELLKNDKPVYNAAVRKGWHDHLSKGKKKYSDHSSNIWTFEKVKEEALKYKSIKEFATNSRSAYFKAVYSKWLLQLIDHMDGGYTKWTLEKIVQVLKNHDPKNWYKTKECKAPLAYAKRHGIFEEVQKKLKSVE
jgi:hypothetical protein